MDPERSLFKGEKTPLGKYDIIRRATFLRQGSASDFEDAEFSKFKNPPDWRGLCDGWAMASVLFEEPLESVWKSVDNRWIELTPYDLKALIIKSYEDVGSIDGSDTPNMKYYGMKFDGADSWILPDIFPEQFHRFLEEVMFNKRELFLMDHDPKQEIWTEPVYGSEYEIKAGPTPDSVDVKTWVYSADPRKKWEDRNKQGIFIRSRSYQYRLYGTVDASGVLTVNSGEWMNREGTDSTVDHPDYFIRLINPAQLSRATRNPYLETDVVDSLLEDSYDLAQQKKNQGNK
jgi:hypothetical protein